MVTANALWECKEKAVLNAILNLFTVGIVTRLHCIISTRLKVMIVVTVQSIKFALSAGLHNHLIVKTNWNKNDPKQKESGEAYIRIKKPREWKAADWSEREEEVSRWCNIMQAKEEAESEVRVAKGSPDKTKGPLAPVEVLSGHGYIYINSFSQLSSNLKKK